MTRNYSLDEINENLQRALAYLAQVCHELELENDELRVANVELTTKVGKKSNRKVLRRDEPRAIRKAYESGKYTQAELAGMYGINRATVSRIVRGIYHPGV